jgi:glycosyltransferase involved in cell wall biosynthesis
LKLILERQHVLSRLKRESIDVWFTYHSYYKAPDLLGSTICKTLEIPYVIFQGIYSTKRRRQWKTRPGFYLNQKCLLSANRIFANKTVDLHNLKRLIPENRLTYVAPGITPGDFIFDDGARSQLRRKWGVRQEPVIFSAAMFRPDVKTEGLTWVIRACGELYRQGQNFRLVIAGDGRERDKLLKLTHQHIPDRTVFVGRVPRRDMYRYYSAADLFVFPGIRESLGMVFLEAQACGLPVVAFNNAGVPEAVQDGKTGLLVPIYDLNAFVSAIMNLIVDGKLRQQMGAAAKSYVREFHDLNLNYKALEASLTKLSGWHQS